MPKKLEHSSSLLCMLCKLLAFLNLTYNVLQQPILGEVGVFIIVHSMFPQQLYQCGEKICKSVYIC